MARTLSILALTALVVGLSASPAHAQRDPFQPPAGYDDVAPGQPEPSVEEPAGGEAVQAPPERLADTGADGRPWLALSYVLVAFGVVLVVGSKLRRPDLE